MTKYKTFNLIYQNNNFLSLQRDQVMLKTFQHTNIQLQYLMGQKLFLVENFTHHFLQYKSKMLEF